MLPAGGPGKHRGVVSSAQCRAPRLRAGRSAARAAGAGGRLSLSMPGRRRNRYGEGRHLWRPARRTGNASREVVAGNRFHEYLRRPGRRRLVTVRYLMYVLLPAWFVPGVADYVMHRRTRIERASGLGESGTHALMMAERYPCRSRERDVKRNCDACGTPPSAARFTLAKRRRRLGHARPARLTCFAPPHSAAGSSKISVTRVPRGPESACIWFATRRTTHRP